MTKPRRPRSTALAFWVTLFIAAHCLAAPPTEGLIHWWPDPAEGTDQVTGHKGIRRGFGPTEENPEVRFGYAAGWVELRPGITNRTFTISGWRREPPLQSKGESFTMLSQGSNLQDGWALRMFGAAMQFVEQPALNPYSAGGIGPVPTQWQAFVVRAMPREVEFWADGVRVVVWPVSWPSSNDTGPLCVGNCAIGNSPWDGDLRDLRIYDRVLTEAEIQALAASTRSGPTPAPAESDTMGVRTVVIELGSSADYSIQRFTTDDGLPNSGVQCLLPRKAGSLWLGTEEGLTCFDGRQFVMPDAATAAFRATSTDVRAIIEDRLDTCWLGTFNGLIRHQADQWRAYTNMGPARLIRCLVPAADGTIWFAGNRDPAPRGRAQLRRIDPDSGRLLVDIPVPGQVHGLQLATDGVWIATEEPAAVWHFREASGSVELVAHISATAAPSDDSIYRPVPLVRVLRGTGTPKVQAEVWQESTGSFQWAQVSIGTHGPTWTWTRLPTEDWHIVKTSSNSSLPEWVPMTAGLLHRDRERWQLLDLGGSINDVKVTALASTRDGGIWAATKGDGLWLVRPRLVRMLPSEQGWATEEPMSLQRMHDGRLLVGGRQHAAARIDPQALMPPEISPREIGGLVAECSDGRVVGLPTNPGPSAFSLERGNIAGLYAFRVGSNLIEALFDASQIHFSQDGGVWITTQTGVYHTPKVPEVPSNGETIYLEPSDFSVLLNQLPKRVQLHGLAEASDGAIWIGSTGAGLFRIFKGQVENFPDSTLAADNPIVPVGFSSDGTLWLGSEDGLGIFREGRYRWVRPTNGLPESVVCDVEEAEGHVWFAGRRGIHAIRRDNLEAFFAGKTTQVSALSLGRSDGLASTEVQLKSQPAMARTDDGQLWVATARGVAHFHPKEVLSRLRPPPMAVDSLKLDGRPFPLGRGPISLPPGSGRVVEIAFSSLSFVAPERVKFHYRLTGPDGPEDRVSDDTIQGYAVFTHLRPGRHVFTVSARSGNGLVSDPPAKLEFDIEPQFYETGWFRVAMGLFGLTTMAGFISFRLSRADRAAALQQERRLSAERQRIARDMHDELGAELTRLAIRVGNQTTGGNSSQPSASQTARGLLRSLDETVWVVNPDKDSLESMVNYLGTWIREYFTETQIGLSIDLPATIPQLAVSAEWRHHLLRAVKEACHNILKHANATHVEFSIQVADGGRTLELRLGDDGCGFEVQEGTGALGGDSSFQLGGNGLKNLRRRAEQLNAVLKIESAPDHGARIHLIVPLPVSLKG